VGKNESPRLTVRGGRRGGSVRQQVAAVCYRTGSLGIEFLLVRTRGGRWIFPKGGVEPGLTQAQSAALEAYEEAGVHGRIEEMPFARYRVGKPGAEKSKSKRRRNGNSGDAVREVASETVTAHLCEVSHLEAPQEAYRTPTWYTAEKTKRRLMADRDAEFGEELASLVDRAASRIQRLAVSGSREFQNDALRKVRFEALEGMPPLGLAADGGYPRRSPASAARQLLSGTQGVRPSSRLELDGGGSSPVRRKPNYVQ